MNTEFAPLKNLRILELSGGKVDMCGRILADLGAEVVLVEPPEGSPSRHQDPLYRDTSLYFASHHANKLSVQLDLSEEAEREQFLQLVAKADILINSLPSGSLASLDLPEEIIRERNSGLIRLDISDFGKSGPYHDFQATNSIHMALAGVVARSGIYGRDPLLPPSEMSVEAAALQAAWVALLALIKRQDDGVGHELDFSIFDATAQLIDPGLGVTGSAAGGKTAAQLAQRGRPPLSPFYPIFPCKDGHVRVCILNPRQWSNMSTWLGNDHPLTDPSYGNLTKRFKKIKEVNRLISDLFASQSGAELVAEGQARGIPIAKLSTPQEVLQDPHFLARNAFQPLSINDSSVGQLVAAGYLEIDGVRCGPRSPAPRLNDTQISSLWNGARESRAPSKTPISEHYHPLQGIRVLDLGVIVAGAELGRLLSDQGAEVIKIENNAYPDGLRQSFQGENMTHSFAQGSRGKLSFGLNLRNPEGLELFKQLVAKSDVVLSNFKPGTMDSLGLSYDVLKKINPRIIVADSSALGNSGPRSKSMGYGPLVRASTGLTGLWRYPDDDNNGFSDGITIYPDHFAARVSAVGIAALLLRRQQTGIGGTVSLSQAECILNMMATELLQESLEPGSLQARGNHSPFDAPNSLFPCAGNDQWCAIVIRHDDDLQRLCSVLGQPELAEQYPSAKQRLEHRGELEAILTKWTESRTPDEVMTLLQGCGVPAGKMHRVEELGTNPHLLSRLFIRRMMQPGITKPMLTENGPVSNSTLPDPDIRPSLANTPGNWPKSCWVWMRTASMICWRGAFWNQRIHNAFTRYINPCGN